ncbi:MAG: ABC transporter ATP-binding protein [Gaiellaceae bacterium MAG52_C11]|nr:ABC transporter ATP-binding protein [Candidatus Gaiellasilicea maunaloa]
MLETRSQALVDSAGQQAAEESQESMVQLRSVTKYFANVAAVDGIDLDVAEGEVLTLLGPSGCGKSTTLRCITGSLEIDAGTIQIGGKDVTRVPTHGRHIGLVFQNFALFPHMTVTENVAFPLKVRRVAKHEIRSRVAQALELVQLGQLGKRLPRELSGGQQQRVGLARAIVYRPRVVLFDEPLSNLDAMLRREMRYEIRRLCDELGFTAIYVTHDQEEALALSDRIAVMKDGIIHQIGAPDEIYASPRTLFVAQFLGNPNRNAGTLTELRADEATVRIGTTTVETPLPLDEIALGSDVVLVVRPEVVRIANSAEQTRVNMWEARISAMSFLGERREYVLTIDEGFELRAYLPPDVGHALGDVVRVEVPIAECRVYPGASASVEDS